jgi:hypothetical protein
LFLFLKKNKIWYDEETLRGLYKPRIVFNEWSVDGNILL